jgi:hypothetical protein
MKAQKHLAIWIWVILAACSSADNTKIPGIGNGLAMDAQLPADNAFRQQPANTIIQFLRWYRSNVKQLKQIQLVTHSANPDSAQYFVVNMPATEKYLSELQKSGFVSDKYIDSWRAYFQENAEELKKNPQTTGPFKGFNFDFVMWSKDYDEDLAKIEKSTVESQTVANNQASITIGLPTTGKIKYRISKQGDKWLIDDIKDMRSVLDQPEND